MHILLSNSQAGPDRTVKQEQDENSRNHVQAFFPGSVLIFDTTYATALVHRIESGNERGTEHSPTSTTPVLSDDHILSTNTSGPGIAQVPLKKSSHGTSSARREEK